jgi:hypothetical protein
MLVRTDVGIGRALSAIELPLRIKAVVIVLKAIAEAPAGMMIIKAVRASISQAVIDTVSSKAATAGFSAAGEVTNGHTLGSTVAASFMRDCVAC